MSTRSDETVRIRRDALAELAAMVGHLGRYQDLCYCAQPQFECAPCWTVREVEKVLGLERPIARVAPKTPISSAWANTLVDRVNDLAARSVR